MKYFKDIKPKKDTILIIVRTIVGVIFFLCGYCFSSCCIVKAIIDREERIWINTLIGAAFLLTSLLFF